MSNDDGGSAPRSPPAELRFEDFRLRGPHGPLHATAGVVDLPRKALALLWLLASRAGEVVTKDEMLAAVWPRVVVGEGAIAATLRDLRRALGDDARRPRLIATAHRIGYRFIADVTRDGARPDAGRVDDPVEERAELRPPAPDPIVGRSAERARLTDAYARAAAGQRQVVFVSGEAGIGKTRLVDDFLASIVRARSPSSDSSDGLDAARPRIGVGQCIEHHGAGEPYLPILEAVTRLCRGRDGASLSALLRRHAPTWVAQLPGVFGDGSTDGAPQGPAAGSLERMLREMADAIDVAAADRLLVLVLEDMHWSDRSSLDALAMLARRREPAHLLVLATCRPIELIVNQHPLKHLKQDLVTRRAASEITLGRLAAADVRAFVEQRLGDREPPGDLAAAMFRRSQGHPLFMVHLADDLLRAPDLGTTPDESSLPCGVADLIEAQLVRLAPEQLALLEAASVAGIEFAAASAAAGMQCAVDDAERILEPMALRAQFIEPRGLAAWLDGTVSSRYGFRHDLVRDALYRRLGAARRARLHRAIGQRLAEAHGAHGGDIAAELAVHFENAHDFWRAAGHRREAGDKALHRHAHREALVHAERGLELLATTAVGVADRDAVELKLRLVEGSALLALKGYAAPEVEATYTRALDLALEPGADGTAIGPALSGLYNLYLTRAAFPKVKLIAEQVLAQLRSNPDPVLLMLAHNVRGTAQFFAGDAAASLEHVDRTLALYDADAHRHLAIVYGEDPAVACHHYAALTRWILGYPESARRHLRAGFDLADGLAHPFGQAQMLWMEAVIALDDGDLDQVERSTRRLDAICEECGFPLWQAGGRILRGAALVGRGRHDEGRRLTDDGLCAWREAGTLLTLPHALAVAARVEALDGRIEAAARLLDDACAVVESTGERWYEAELYRLQGELMLRRPGSGGRDTAGARACFERAIEVAGRQQATTLELRASVSLAALPLAPAESARARDRLAAVAKRMPEGREGRDMARAEALLRRNPTPSPPARSSQSA